MALDYGFYDRGSDATSPGVAPSAQTPTGIPANGDKARFTRHEVTWTNRLTPLPGLDAAMGVDMQAEHGVDDGYLQFGPAKLPTHFALGPHLVGGLRRSALSGDAGFQPCRAARAMTIPAAPIISARKLRADYALADWGTQFQLMLGQGLQASQLLCPGQSHCRRSHSEAGRGGEFRRRRHPEACGISGRWKTEAYATNYRDLIDFRPGAVPKLVNLSTVHVRGIETSLR